MGDDWIYCLGVKAFGLCQYNPLMPNTAYFSIGEAIGSIALLLAFTQLVSPTFKFRFQVRHNTGWAAVVLFFLALFCVAIAAAIPSVLGYVVPVVGFPIFWELLGEVLVVSGVILLSTIYLRPTEFTTQNYKE